MSRRTPFPALRRLGALSALAGLALVLMLGGALAARASAASSAGLTGWLGGGTKFPNRALVLFPSANQKLNASNVHVTENGAAAGPLTVTPSSHAGPGDFGVMVLVDQNTSMRGAPIGAVMSGVKAFAGLRSGNQDLGLITFDARPTVFMQPSSNAAAINHRLTFGPWTGSGVNVPAAIQAGLTSLSKLKVALGAIIVVSDGVGSLSSSSGPTPAQVKAAAAAARVPVITIGLKDAKATAASLSALQSVSPGQFVQTAPSKLDSVFTSIYATLTRGYVVRWHSSQPTGRPVNISATAAGVAGTVTASYQITPPAPVHHVTPKPATPASMPHFSLANQLSQSPSFASAVAPASVAPPVSTTSQGQSFWSSSAATPIVAGIVALLIAATIAFALYKPSQRAVRMRVGSFIPSAEPPPEDPLALPTQAGRGLLRALERGTWWPPFVENVEISRNPHSAAYLVKRAAVIAVVLAVLVTVLTGSALYAVVPLLGWPFALRALVKRQAQKQRDKFRDTLPGYLQDLASAMRVGRSFVGGLTAVAETADEPVRSEIERAITDEALGLPLDVSLEAMAQRMQAPDVDQVALIAALNKRSGSNVAEALDRVAEGARDRADLRREIRALTAQAKMSSMVLTGLPAVLLIGMSVISPLYAHPLFHTTLGLVLLFVGAGLSFTGWKVMKKITTVEA